MSIIGLNTLFLIPGQVGGTERYTRTLLDGLAELDTHNQYVVFCNQENFSTFSFKNKHWRVVNTGVKASNKLHRLVFEQTQLPKLANKYECDVLHSLGYIGPVAGVRGKTIVTVHDANWRDWPTDFSLAEQVALTILIEPSLHRANLVVTDSDFAQSRLKHHFPKQRFTVISPWVDPRLNAKKTIRLRPMIDGTYYLCVSAFYPHKNVPYLLKLWQASYHFNRATLVLVGQRGRDEQGVQELLKSTPNTQHFKSVSESQLRWLYANAAGCIAPSLYEGFGYSVYEGLSFGLPVLVGDKQLYPKHLHRHFSSLSGELATDLIRLKRYLAVARKKDLPELPSKPTSIVKLVSLYETLTSSPHR